MANVAVHASSSGPSPPTHPRRRPAGAGTRRGSGSSWAGPRAPTLTRSSSSAPASASSRPPPSSSASPSRSYSPSSPSTLAPMCVACSTATFPSRRRPPWALIHCAQMLPLSGTFLVRKLADRFQKKKMKNHRLYKFWPLVIHIRTLTQSEVMDTCLAYAPVKNNPEDTAKVPKGNPYHIAKSREMAIYRANNLILRKVQLGSSLWLPHNSMMVGTYVFIKSWRYKNKNIALGTVLGTDPNQKVGGRKLGKEFLMLGVGLVSVPDEPLVRPYGNFKVIGDVDSNLIAWPSTCVQKQKRIDPRS